jgi:hypothetical protein
MTGTTTGETALATATDSDDVENYGTVALPVVLQTIADKFDHTAGHDHSGAGAGKLIPSTALAANAVTQVGFSKGLTSSPTTTSTTYVTLDGDGSSNELRVDLTTTGGDLLCWLAASLFNSTAGQTVSVALSLDAGTEVGDQEMVAPSSNYREQMSTVWRFTGVSAAAHVVRARWKVGANTGTAQSTFRNLLVMEVKR